MGAVSDSVPSSLNKRNSGILHLFNWAVYVCFQRFHSEKLTQDIVLMSYLVLTNK